MKYALIGEKLGHSFSKDIHERLGNKDYVLHEVPRDEINSFIDSRDFLGINVTIPYKQTVIPHLDYVDPAALEIGAVNTIVNRDGKLSGFNTDYIGLRKLIISTGLVLRGKKVLILGTGGTSKTARAVAASLGASEVVVVSRKASGEYVSYEDAVTVHSDAYAIINTTPCGMFPDSYSSPISLDPFTKLHGVIDVVYNPLRTRLVLDAQKRGLKTSGGLFMLVCQAVAAHEFFFDTTVDDSVTEGIYNDILANKRNIVLVGMPGSGKSTVGRLVAKQLDCSFVDTDDMVIEKSGLHPAQLMKEKGEKFFRDVESECCHQASAVNHQVVATGGGAVLRPENVLDLKSNGTVVFLDRSIDDIKPTGDRPLSDSRDKLQQLFQSRYPVYVASADVIVRSRRTVKQTVAAVLEALK